MNVIHLVHVDLIKLYEVEKHERGEQIQNRAVSPQRPHVLEKCRMENYYGETSKQNISHMWVPSARFGNTTSEIWVSI